MQKKDQYKRLIQASAAAVIPAVQTGLFALVWFFCYGQEGAIQFVRGNYALIGLYVLTSFFFYHIFGGLRISYARVFEMLYAQIISVLCINTVAYLQLCLICRWQLMTNMVPMLALTLVQLIAVNAWSFLFRRLFRIFYPPRPMLLVYGDYSPGELLRKLQMRGESFHIQAEVSADTDIDTIKRMILKTGTVLMMDAPSEMRNELLKFCFQQDIRCYCVPKLSDVMVRSAHSIHLMDTTLLLFRNMGLSADQKWVKRGFDVAAALLALVIFSPVMLVIALSIRLCDGGPVLFSQNRLTRDGKVFRVYKFRSMHVQRDAEEYVMTRKNDSRVTAVGRIIRNIHFDELPQLFNILKGDMSFVGPRPECPELAERYGALIPEFPCRLKVKAGLTGYAQVYGKYNSTPYDKLKMDLHYIENYSLLLDIKLMLLTVKILFQKENTEGIEAWQTSAAPETGKKETP